MRRNELQCLGVCFRLFRWLDMLSQGPLVQPPTPLTAGRFPPQLVSPKPQQIPRYLLLTIRSSTVLCCKPRPVQSPTLTDGPHLVTVKPDTPTGLCTQICSHCAGTRCVCCQPTSQGACAFCCRPTSHHPAPPPTPDQSRHQPLATATELPTPCHN
jgi:hypothetical protein